MMTGARVVVMGAGGEMGRVAARMLATNEAIAELVLADVDLARAQRAAASIGSAPEAPAGVGAEPGRTQASPLAHPRLLTRPSVRVEHCDVFDSNVVRRLLDDADLVVGCAGPFFRVGVPILEAAIDTGTTYLDICDDPEPTIEMLQLDGAARRAGVAAVVGMGASPGVSNLLAARAAHHLDTVTDCMTGWSLDDEVAERDGAGAVLDADTGGLIGPDGTPTGAVIHFMEQIHGTVPVVEGGVLVHRAPLGAVEIDYPGLGRGTGYVVGHPEPITLHRSFGVAGRSCNVVLVADPATAAYLRGVQRDLDRGAIDLEQAGRALLSPTARRTARAVVDGARLRGSGPLPRLFALVRGTAGGHDAVVGCHVTAMPRGMAGATSIPAALAVDQLLRTAPPAGVHPPEAVVDGDRLLADLVTHCVRPPDGLDALAPVSIRLSEPSPPTVGVRAS
jgi:NAD(P)-dependent dehydrogenase (short-subunit alcohol dehydrogenase family)